MKWIRQRVLRGEILAGTFLNLGSNMTVEIAGRAGFDWLLIDMEHGAGDYPDLVHQLQAADCTPAAPLVRIAWNEVPRFKRVLDLGPSGVMVPWVSTAEEARQAVAAMRYPPYGIRGAASFNRACAYGKDFEEYFARASQDLLTIVQIESPQAVSRAEEIAAVDGVDVLFVGPLDLSVNLGTPRQLDRPDFREALKRVIAASHQHGKAAGILLWKREQLEQAVSDGFSFIGLGSDGAAVGTAMNQWAAALNEFKKTK
jgi:2-keto-3-deoxy-L-rhamnonate aldolase RhmA